MTETVNTEQENVVNNEVAESTVEQESSIADILNSEAKEEAGEQDVVEAAPEENKEKEVETPQPTIEELQEKIAKLEKQERDTKNWGHRATRKLSAYKAQAKKLLEDGALTDTEAEPLLREATIDELQEEVKEVNPNQEQMGIWQKEVGNMYKYTEDVEGLQQRVNAIDHFLQNGDQEDVQGMFSYLEQYKHDPVVSTKKMLEIADKYNKEVYQDITEAGGVIAMKAKYKSKITEQQKTIDKLNKEMLKLKQNSDYIPSNGYDIPSGATKASNEVQDSSMDSIFNRARSGYIRPS